MLPPLMLFLAWMMFSHFRYPSFKGISWHTTRSLPRFLIILFIIVCTVVYYEWMPFALFLSYLLYGFFRPFLSRKMKKEIEEEMMRTRNEEKTAAATLVGLHGRLFSAGPHLHPAARLNESHLAERIGGGVARARRGGSGHAHPPLPCGGRSADSSG